jgi:hypothetical protein
MSIFLTKVWGFGVPFGPLQFSQKGYRETARSILSAGDLVVLVGTEGPQTQDDEKGRLLGLVEPTTEPVLSLDYPLLRLADDINEHGVYRWPFGLITKNAWKIIDRPLLKDISQRKFDMTSVSGIVPLFPAEVDRVLSLRREKVELLSSFRIDVRTKTWSEVRRHNAPPPSGKTRTGVMHIRRAPAVTYAMELVGSSQAAFKIGWALDHTVRERQFNLYALPALGGLKYKVVIHEPWETAAHAFKMEQAVLKQFHAKRHAGNGEVICGVSLSELMSAWRDYVYRARMR